MAAFSSSSCCSYDEQIDRALLRLRTSSADLSIAPSAFLMAHMDRHTPNGCGKPGADVPRRLPAPQGGNEGFLKDVLIERGSGSEDPARYRPQL
jgi:hypothetical protein